jgi:SAM-dependent methyltransferase
MRDRAVERLKAGAPWYVKVPLKLALSVMPLRYGWLSRVGVRRHGEMTDPAYAYEVFGRHADRVDLKPGFTLLELGPGDSLASAVIAAARGASGSVLVDQGDFAVAPVDVYKALAASLREGGLDPPDLATARTRAEVLLRCNATYLTGGLESLESLPADSVDFAFSHAVLEHVRAAEVAPVSHALHRVIRAGGRCSHTVDLRDHLGEALNHLRFGRKRWESRLFANSGFYTNRLTYHEYLDAFRQAGFVVDDLSLTRWRELPTPRSKLARPFRGYSDETLLVSGFDVLLCAGAQRG